MAYMRGTYYVYRSFHDAVHIHVGNIIRPDDEWLRGDGMVPDELCDSPEAIEEYETAGCHAGMHAVIPLRVMQDLAAKFWLELSQEEKDRYMQDPHFEPYRIRARRKDE